MRKNKIRLWIAAGLLVLLTGCFSQSVDELYAPPKAPDDYLKLDVKIDEVLSQGGEYAAPLSGELTQKVQLQDLDGDGVKEAIAFFRVSTDEQPLKIYIYRQVEEEYEVAAIIEGTGNAINSVYYANLDDRPDKEIIVSWQVSDSVHSLVAYSIHRNEVEELLRTDYAAVSIFDLDSDGQEELLVLQSGETDGLQPGTSQADNRVELYNFQDGALELDSVAPLSRNITSAAESVLKTGYLRNEIPALFISSSIICEEERGQVTDVFAWRGGEIENITLVPNAGDPSMLVSSSTIRWYTDVSAADINGDGILELPSPYKLSAPRESGTDFWVIRWQQFDINGFAWPVYTTYHNVRDGWYLILPSEWEGKITLSRSDLAGGGERAVIFSYWDGKESSDPVAFLAVYQLYGDNKERRAKLPGRFRLNPAGEDITETIYAARLFPEAWDCGLDEDGVRENFSLIVSDFSIVT